MNTWKPKVTIVIPSYQQADYLEATILSVLNQKWENLEVIVVDGGSTDGSLEIIQKYQQYFSWWVSEKDNGHAEAVNKGWQKGTGDIFAWLNSDDILLPRTVEKIVELFENNVQAGLVYGDVLSIDQHGDVFNVMRFQPWQIENLMQFQIISQPAVFVRRQVLEQTGFLDDSFHFLMDHHLWLRAASMTQMVYQPEIFAAARYHSEAKNVKAGEGFGREAFRIVNWMQTVPTLQPLYKQNKRKILSGAWKLQARYLLDAGQSSKAFWSYLQSVFYCPSSGLMEWHRLVFSLLSMAGLSFLKEKYYQDRLTRYKKEMPQIFTNISHFLSFEKVQND